MPMILSMSESHRLSWLVRPVAVLNRIVLPLRRVRWGYMLISRSPAMAADVTGCRSGRVVDRPLRVVAVIAFLNLVHHMELPLFDTLKNRDIPS